MIPEAVLGWNEAVGTDSETVRLRRGDPQALVAMVSRYQHRLYRYLLRIARDPSAAEDLFQQTWLRVVANLKRYDPEREFDAWLFAVAHNVAMDHLRRREPESLDERMETRGAEPHAEPEALERAAAGERAARLETALGELPAVYREVLALRFEEDMKLEEIAGVCGAPLSTVKSRLRRGLEALRRKLPAEELR